MPDTHVFTCHTRQRNGPPNEQARRCEHLALHSCMRARNASRMYVNPLMTVYFHMDTSRREGGWPAVCHAHAPSDLASDEPATT